MATKTKKEILDLLKDDVISVDEAVEMLNKLDQALVVMDEQPTGIEKPKLSYNENIEKIVQDTVNDIDFEYVFKVMQEKGWTYKDSKFNDHPVTREEVRNMMEYCVREALRNMVVNGETDDYLGATVGTGGFEAHAWVDENDTAIQVELKFVPETGFGGDMDIDELMSSYTDEDRDDDYKRRNP